MFQFAFFLLNLFCMCFFISATAILCPELPSIRDGRTFQDSSDGMRNDYQSVTKYTCSSGKRFFSINRTKSQLGPAPSELAETDNSLT